MRTVSLFVVQMALYLSTTSSPDLTPNLLLDKGVVFSCLANPISISMALEAQEILQDELGHGVSKAGVGVGVEDLDVYGDVESLPGGWGEPEEANLQTVLHDVLILRPHDLGQLPQVGDLRVQRAVNNRKIKPRSSPPSRNVL